MSLTARLTSRSTLHYTGGADLGLDRPAHIRGGSSLAWVAGRIALIQDDANFVALIDPWSGDATAITLPPGIAGVRQFDGVRGNKKYRLDLEACVAIEGATGPMLLAFGSGSSTRREHVLLIEGVDQPAVVVTLVPAARFYDALRNVQAFSGSALDLEGALRQGARLRLFSRGNGAPAEGMLPINAACSVNLEQLLTHLGNPEFTEPPAPTDIARYDLGTLGGVPLGFTDAMAWHDSVLYTAAAEASPDAIRDGPVTGSVIGVIDSDGSTRWAPITGPAGEMVRVKAEGLVADPGSESRLFVVLDPDDPAAPSELCTVELAGEWLG